MRKTIIGTRIYSDPSGVSLACGKLERWVRQSELHADVLVIATDATNSGSILNLPAVRTASKEIIITECDASENFVRPLNSILDTSLRLGADILIYQSAEIDAKTTQIEILKKHLDDHTLVVGAKIIDGHGSSTGKARLSGWDSPWNTLAMWNPRKLGKVGFSPISSGLYAGIPAGAEEVVVISLLQSLFNESHQAKLVDVGSINWDLKFDSEWRKRYHQTKLQSKNKRASVQLEALGITAGFVAIL